MAAMIDSLGQSHTVPFTDPHFIRIMIPCKGTDKEVGKFDIINPTSNRVTFKIRGTKIGEFSTVDPSCGYIGPSSQVTVTCQPKVIASVAGWTKLDKFTIQTAVAPEGDTDPKEFWKQPTTKASGVLSVQIKVCDAAHPDGL